jgi:colanic acid/amylovoran biosynthesis glycosyltransferase
VGGAGPRRRAGRAGAAGLGMSDAVELPGRRPHDQVAEAMAGARAFVQHSVTTANGDAEGTPVAVMEAGAAGLPVVSTRHGGISDVVLEGETGSLVDERDVEGMAKHMAALAGDPALAGRLGRAARERIVAEFSTQASVDALWQILQEAIGSR